MKTLKQILEPLKSLTKGDKLLCIMAVKEWLQQKQKEKKEKIKNETNYQFLQNLKASIWAIDELLEELK